MGWNTYQHMYIPLLQLFYNFPLTSLTQGISYTLFLFHISLACYIWAQKQCATYNFIMYVLNCLCRMTLKASLRVEYFGWLTDVYSSI